MRTSLFSCTSILFVAPLAVALGQWSSDPAAPLALCDAAAEQRYIHSVEDGAGGWFVFWLDKRDGDGYRAIYGQHLDADGYAQWPANGLLFVQQPGSNINDMDVETLNSGDLLLLYGRGSGGNMDTLETMRFDPDGMPVWTAPTLIAIDSSPVLGFNDFAMQASGTGALITYRATVSGGSEITRVDRVNADGSLAIGLNGQSVNTSGYGPLDMVSDGNDGAIIVWRNGNGAGTHMGAYRIDAQCTPLWTAVVDPVAGSSGLGWEYRATSDGQGGLAIAFVQAGGGNGITFTRIDGDGNTAITPAFKTVGDFASGQDLPRILLHDGYFFVGWEDNRPPAANSDLYMQKLDIDGDPQWDPAGVLAVHVPTYIPSTGIAPTDSGGVIVVQLGSSGGFVAQRVRSDGTSAWPAPVTLANSSIAPFYAEYQVRPHMDGGAVAFWYNNSSQDLFATHVNFNGVGGVTSGITEDDPDPALFSVGPNPTNGRITVRTRKRSIGGSIALHDRTGGLVWKRPIADEVTELDTRSLAAGIYLIRVTGPSGANSARTLVIE
ncbi:MAG: T9SS type A sorting domain-containing protein [Flavobacteriales bacterium]|nr:T9SS type A sorting domain-containing protein [Flavobacteriales bacterium]MCB9168433.1 T9SS type A sorting domain-containing protein [Flavobacteriales bacterium]